MTIVVQLAMPIGLMVQRGIGEGKGSRFHPIENLAGLSLFGIFLLPLNPISCRSIRLLPPLPLVCYRIGHTAPLHYLGSLQECYLFVD